MRTWIGDKEGETWDSSFKSGHFTQTLVVDQRIWFVDVRRATSGKQSPLGDCGGSGSIHGPLKIGLV